MQSRNKPRAGFTLVEVLAALMITAGFVAVVLPFAGRLATRWWVGEIAVETADGWMQALARLSDDLSQAVPIAVQQGDKDIIVFAAGPGFVQFIRPAVGGAGGMRLETIRYDVSPSAAGHALVRRAGPFSPTVPADPGSPATLLDGPFLLRFRAYGHDNVPHAAWTIGRDAGRDRTHHRGQGDPLATAEPGAPADRGRGSPSDPNSMMARLVGPGADLLLRRAGEVADHAGNQLGRPFGRLDDCGAKASTGPDCTDAHPETTQQRAATTQIRRRTMGGM